MKIGFIGTGVMGSAIVRHLQKAGHELTVYNRTKAKGCATYGRRGSMGR